MLIVPFAEVHVWKIRSGAADSGQPRCLPNLIGSPSGCGLLLEPFDIRLARLYIIRCCGSPFRKVTIFAHRTTDERRRGWWQP